MYVGEDLNEMSILCDISKVLRIDADKGYVASKIDRYHSLQERDNLGRFIMSRTRYILVSREGYHDTAVDTETLDLMMSYPHYVGEITASRPITMAELKKNRVHVTVLGSIELQVDRAQLTEMYQGKILKAKVLWFDRLRGAGRIELLENGEKCVLYACNISGAKTWFESTACVYYNADDLIDVEVLVDAGFLIKSHTPGIVDTEKWNSLDHDKLAFVNREEV